MAIVLRRIYSYFLQSTIMLEENWLNTADMKIIVTRDKSEVMKPVKTIILNIQIRRILKTIYQNRNVLISYQRHQNKEKAVVLIWYLGKLRMQLINCLLQYHLQSSGHILSKLSSENSELKVPKKILIISENK